MSLALGALYSRQNRDAVLWAALALSLALHALLMLGWLPLHPPNFSSLGDPDAGKRGGHSLPLAVRIAERTRPPMPEAVATEPAHVVQPRAPQHHEPAPKGAPRVLLAERAPSAVPRLEPLAAPRPGKGDFLADLAARRTARENSEQKAQAPAPAPSAATALSFGTSVGPGGEMRDGGIFRIERMTPTEATVVFYRMNRDVQRVEVGIGGHLSIQLAIVREVIAVMRESGFTGDVGWMSERLGRVVQISARERDSVQLEAFLLTEFFPADRMRRPPDSAATRQ